MVSTNFNFFFHFEIIFFLKFFHPLGSRTCSSDFRLLQALILPFEFFISVVFIFFC
ncbi:hypothetical protein RhiirC2_118783 [Rhizophagus irregularis]|uniref:Uncharacterized protein n=1 Tax=Rhizophagus irregularis TaxID=588596 RepID=A0A2N1MQS4_9GLOM|nr:hypothetical protein RhiirC2_118783 [Rhizophagus irregularis]